jgi:hypothetical protein
MRKEALFSLLLIAATVVPCYSQQIQGGLEGHVVDTAGVAIAGVTVEVNGPSLLGTRSVRSNPRGLFQVVGLPVGTYTVRISADGYREAVFENTRIQLGRTTTLGQVELPPDVFELEPLVVSAERPIIDPVSTNLGANLNARTFEQLPIARNYLSAVALLPHTTPSYLGDPLNIAGSTGLENMYFIDGVNVTTPYRATGGTRLPHNFIEEIEVKQGGYEAEYGKALGGIVNVITHTGANEWETDVFGFFTGSGVTAEVRPGLGDFPIGSFATYDLGARVSGPIKSDRLWLSAAYNPQVERRDVEIPVYGETFEDRRVQHQFAAKATWLAAERTRLTLSAFGDPTTHHHVGPAPLVSNLRLGAPQGGLQPDPFLWYSEDGSASVSFAGRHTLSPTVYLELDVSQYWGNEDLRGDTEAAIEPLYADIEAGLWEGGIGGSKRIRNQRFSTRLSATTFLGAHTVKAGVGYESNKVESELRYTFIAKLTSDGQWANYFETTGPAEIVNRVPTLFLQDSWRVHRRLSLNVGLRWDSQYVRNNTDASAQDFANEWQPRVGLTYLPGELGSQKVFAHYGRFYQQMPLGYFTVFATPRATDFNLYDRDPRQPDVEPIAVFGGDGAPHQQVDGLEGEHLDEFVVGYERAIGSSWKITTRAVHRILRNAFVVGTVVTPREFFAGNPGSDPVAFLPRFEREYSALELSAAWTVDRRLDLGASYVLSQTWGNYSGLYTQETQLANTGQNWALETAEQIPNSKGLLPNDRTHVAKLFGSYRAELGLSVGVFLLWASGTPMSEYGAHSAFGIFYPTYLVERGSAGRTPSIWDANLRLAYSPGNRFPGAIILDLRHIGNPQRVVDIEQTRYLTTDQSVANPDYGAVKRHQPPMHLRIGFQLRMQ